MLGRKAVKFWMILNINCFTSGILHHTDCLKCILGCPVNAGIVGSVLHLSFIFGGNVCLVVSIQRLKIFLILPYHFAREFFAEWFFILEIEEIQYCVCKHANYGNTIDRTTLEITISSIRLMGKLTTMNNYQLEHLNTIQSFKPLWVPLIPYVIKNASCRSLVLEIL